MALFTNKQAVGVVVIGAIAIYYLSKKAADVAGALNPTDPNNVINSTFEDIFYPDRKSSLGSDIYDWLHPDEKF